jgi:hypothetical protein
MQHHVTIGSSVFCAVHAEAVKREGVLRQQLEEYEVGVRWPPACEDVCMGAGDHLLVKTQQTEKAQYIL